MTTSPQALHFRLLGELEVTRDGHTVTVPAGKLRVLLAALLLHANHTVGVDTLIDRLWGDAAPAGARGTVQTYVLRLRQLLGEPAISTRTGGYAIPIHPDQLDLLRFQSLVALAGRQPPAQAAGTLRTALSLWRGSALADIASESLRREELPRLAEQRLQALERRIEFDLALGEPDGLVAELSALTGEHPLRERFWGQLMLALLRSGRQAEALDRYRALRDVLADELGVEPGPELRALHAAILRGEPHLASPVRTVPRQLPAEAVAFVGRDPELSTVDGLLLGRTSAICAVHGPAGIGKTTFAVRWGHRASDWFTDGQLYVDLRGFDPDRPPMDPGEALDRFLRALGHDAGQLPADLEERAALYRSSLAGRRVLVLLDNAATVEQVRPLLPGTPTGLVLVTSRNQLTGLVAMDGAHNLTLDVLTPVESALLLDLILGPARVAAEPDAASELAALCGHLPLALRVAAGKLVMRPGLPIAASVEELRDARLSALEVEGDRRAAVRAAFDLSYLALKPDEQTLFRRLGLVPGPDFTQPVAAELTGLPDAGRLLDRLVGVHLVDNPGHGRYRLHDLLRRYARERCDTDEPDGDRAMARLFAWYLGTAQTAVSAIHPHSQQLYDYTTATGSFPDGAAALAWLEAERGNLTAAIHDAARRDLPDTALRLIDAVRGYFIARAYYHDDWQILASAGLRAAERLDDDRARAAMHLNLAVARYGLTDLDAYLRHAATALDLSKSAGWDFGASKALTFLGQGHMERGNPTVALDYLAAARAALPEDSVPQLSYVLVILAHTHHQLGDLEVSRDLFRDVVRIGEELDSPPDQTLGWHGVGLVHTLLGTPDEAWAAFSDCVRIAKALDNGDRAATGLAGLAELAAAAGRHAEASELLDSSQTAASTGRNRHIEVILTMAAGRVRAAAGDRVGAITEFTAALTLTRKIGYRYDSADLLLELAAAHHALDDASTARACAVEALEIAAEAGFRVLTEKARSWLRESGSTRAVFAD